MVQANGYTPLGSSTVHPLSQTELQSDAEHSTKPKWYLAYGSNLNSKVFLGRRKITPLAQKVVLSKGLELSFDLGAVPYLEPRMANTRVVAAPTEPLESFEKEWKGDRGYLLGVAYLVTSGDFRKILMTEGGGASYQPLLVDSQVVSADGKVTDEVIHAYTLCSPITERSRRGPGQSSLRYMKLIRAGAREHEMPSTYIDYLDRLPHYKANWLHRIGSIFTIAMFAPLIFPTFWIARLVTDKDGRQPPFLTAVTKAIFALVWTSHDHFFKHIFGDGENSPAYAHL